MLLQGDLPNPGIKSVFLVSPVLHVRSLTLAPSGKPHQEDSNQLSGHRKGNANMILFMWVITESACNAGNPGSNPGLGRSPGEGNGNPLQYFCLRNPMDRGAWQAIVHGVTKGSDTT